MTKDMQIRKNLELTERLSMYIVSNPDVVKDFPSKTSYIVLTSDRRLNKRNEQLIDSLIAEGNKVVIVTEMDNKNSPWKFHLVN